MKYLITYEYKTPNETTQGQFYFDAEQQPSLTDSEILKAALTDSTKFGHSGLVSIHNIAIQV